MSSSDDVTRSEYASNVLQTAAFFDRHRNVRPVVPPDPKEKAIALYNFIPQDPDTQIPLKKGDTIEVIRKDADGWWLVKKEMVKGLVPGTYVQLENPSGLDEAVILAAREASNKRILEIKQREEVLRNQQEGESSRNDLLQSHAALPSSPRSIGKPIPRKLKKCFACNETILGRTKTAKEQIFHEICLLCKGCREPIEEDEDFTLIRRKAYHVDCAENITQCSVCEKEILGRIYRVGNQTYHKLCIECSICAKQITEGNVESTRLENEPSYEFNVYLVAESELEGKDIVCVNCRVLRERAKREAAQKEAEKQAEELAQRQKIESAKQSQVLEKTRKEEVKESERRKKISERARTSTSSHRRKDTENAKIVESRPDKESSSLPPPFPSNTKSIPLNGNSTIESRARGSSSTSSLGEFDLAARNSAFVHDDRLSDLSNLDGDFDSRIFGNDRDSFRVSEVLDMENIKMHDQNGASRVRGATVDRLSGVSGFSDLSDISDIDRMTASSQKRDEGMARTTSVCFKCSECKRVIPESEGYAEHEGMAFHQVCYQNRYGKKCVRCEKALKGKVIKALESLYHPNCFVCYRCNASLTESFFEHLGNVVCAGCKHELIRVQVQQAITDPDIVLFGTAAYEFVAEDSSQLTIRPGDLLQILRKDPDGWWYAEMNQKRGYVPGSYLVVHPTGKPAQQSSAPSASSDTKPHASSTPSTSSDTKPHASSTPSTSSDTKAHASSQAQCAKCATSNPRVARFCRKCGNHLQN
ncbi:unnamed protein product [Albugo candida]|uniref:Uncharacterized protein n=1 Tax=Albugo candida TaxID=65357 RepID=A0A024G3F3_9STRA|nr:unnamed protein product [Albugo candida]|eukprot:CCI41290.1 unnamed protein product [Albugo candida]